MEAIYAAALKPALWPVALGRIATLHGCPAVHLLTPALHPGAASFGAEPEDGARWLAHLAVPRASYALPAGGASPDGLVFLSQENPPRPELESTLFYLDYLRRVGVGSGGYCAGVVFDGSRPGLVATSCALFHGSDGRAFTDRDKEVHRMTIRHLSRALGTMYRLRDAEMKVAASLAALDRLPSGVMLLGERGNVLFANTMARTLLQQQDGLRLRCGNPAGDELGWLTARHADDQRRLDEAVRGACAATALAPHHFSRGIAIRDRLAPRPLVLQLSALAPGNDFVVGCSTAAAIAFVAAPDRVPSLDESLLTAVFGLTRAECVLARELVSGCGLEAAARRLALSANTVKAQLRGIFEKTGTSRQAQLTRLLLASAVSLDLPEPAARAAVISSPPARGPRIEGTHGASAVNEMVVVGAATPSRTRASRKRRAFPAAPATITVGFAPGGATDILARIVARKLADIIGEAVVVENRTGNSGSASWQNLACARPDGYTLHLAGMEGFAVASLTRRDLPFDLLRDFTPVVIGAVSPIIFIVRDSLPARTLSELLAMAKERPGAVSYASPGATTTNHLAAALLAWRSGAPLHHVAYAGGGPAMVDLLGGRVTMYPAQIPTSRLHVQAGTLRALATAGATRIGLLPAVPTVAEMGYAGFDVHTSYAFFASSKVEPPRLDCWNRAIRQVLEDAQVRAELAAQGLEPAGGSRESMAARIAEERRKWSVLMRADSFSLE